MHDFFLKKFPKYLIILLFILKITTWQQHLVELCIAPKATWGSEPLAVHVSYRVHIGLPLKLHLSVLANNNNIVLSLDCWRTVKLSGKRLDIML